MSRNIEDKFFISQKAVLIRNNKCLILEPSMHSGFWELPGGHLEKGETNTESLKRELKEELGIDSYDYLGVVDYEIWYHGPDNYPVCGIVSLINNQTDKIKMSSEHLQMKWVTEKEIDSYDFLWPAGLRMAKKGFDKYNSLKNE